MSKREMPSAPDVPVELGQTVIPESVKAKWKGEHKAAAVSGRTIELYGAIGDDGYGNGTSSDQFAKMLRSLGKGDITVNIDSPGGSMFAGMAMYNQLINHDGDVTVNVVGTAASAASLVAMAGDTINMYPASFLMIHNCWLSSSGNAEQFIALANTMKPFDAAMADIYSARTGKEASECSAMMAAETWLDAKQAVEQGFADKVVSKSAAKALPIAASADTNQDVSFDATALNALALQMQLFSL